MKNMGYGLNFWGKKEIALRDYETETKKFLKSELGQSKNFDSTGNMIFRGDNLDVLKILKNYYTNKIKMIYIDPPYNTRGKNFLYSDSFKDREEKIREELNLEKKQMSRFNHNGWLCFMYPRLKLARDLLRDDGVIFISIDDNEQANLKLLCDEVFGEENFVGCCPRKSASNRAMAKKFNILHDYILIYGKSILLNLIGPKKDLSSYKNPDNDNNGAWAKMNPSMFGSKNCFEIINPYTKQKDIPPNGRGWIFSEIKMYNMIKEGTFIFKREFKKNQRGFFIKKYLKDISEYNLVSSLEFLNNAFLNQVATKNDITLGFSNPKPSSLLKKIVEISTSKNDIILDFFAGSGTTAQAVMELNKEDGGNRKFILVQLDEEILKDKPAYDFIIENDLMNKRQDNDKKPYISDITIERCNRAGEKILKELDNKSEIDVGYKVFSLVDKKIEDYDL